MTDAIHDQNRVKVGLALSYIDGVTLVPVTFSSSNGGLVIDTTHTIGFTPTQIARRDNNFLPQLMGTNSVTGAPFPLLADPVTGGILVDIA